MWIKAALQVVGCSFVLLFVTHLINPTKWVFPAVLIALMLAMTALLQKSTLVGAIKKLGVWNVAGAALFFVAMLAFSAKNDWQEDIFIYPMALAFAPLLLSVSSYLRERINQAN